MKERRGGVAGRQEFSMLQRPAGARRARERRSVGNLETRQDGLHNHLIRILSYMLSLQLLMRRMPASLVSRK